MSDNKVNILKQLFTALYEVLIEDYTTEISYVLRDIKGILDSLNDCNETISQEKKTQIKSIYQGLFPNHGGLTDFFIWRESFNERKTLNSEYNKLKENIWKELG